MDEKLTPDLLLNAYAHGYFPMAMAADDPKLFWFAPEERGVLPLDRFNIPRGVKRAMKTRNYTVTVDRAFTDVITACAEITATRDGTWINQEIIDLYSEVHRLGHAHSVEVWQEHRLIGGLYGISLGSAFFGESMFSRAPDASKITLVTLVAILREAGYTLLDTQYVNDHLRQFGVEAVPKADYLMRLDRALAVSPNPSKHFLQAAAMVLKQER